MMLRLGFLSMALVVLLGVLNAVTIAPHTASASSPGWWDTSWSCRAEITITENSGSTLTDYQVNVVVPYDSDMQSDFDDVRFVTNDNTTELSYWRDNYSADSSAIFYVEVPSIPAPGTTAILMYYGNPGASTTSDIHNTFIWGDDFEDAAWTGSNIQQVNYGKCSQGIENGQYHQEGVNRSEPIAEIHESGSLKPFPPNYVAEVEVLPLIKTGGAYVCPRYNSVSDKYESLIDIQYDGANLNKVVNDGWTQIVWTGLGYTIEAGSWYRLKAVTLEEGATNRLQVYVNDTMYINQTDPDLFYPGLAFLTYDHNNSFHVVYDNFRVRQYASQEPTFLIGPEETVSGNHSPVLGPIGDKSVNVGELLEFTISADDPDGDLLTYSADNLPDGATFVDLTFSWTPGSGQAGVYPGVHFEVTDGSLTDFEDITITVLSDNQPPVLDPIGDKSVNVGELLEFTISADDPDGDPLTYSAANLPDGATFVDLTFSWTPGSGQAGVYPGVHFEVTDGSLTDFEDITITVNAGLVGILKLLDSQGNGLEGGTAEYYDGGWQYIGSTDANGELAYSITSDNTNLTFRMTYAWASNEKTQDIASDPIVVFQTGQVISVTDNCTHYKQKGSWQTFTNGMELLPSTYIFRFSDRKPVTEKYTVNAGTVNYIE